LNAHSVPEPVPVIRIVKALPVLISNPASASMDHSFVAFSDRLPTESTNTTSSIPSPLPTPKSTDVLVVSSFTDKPKKRSRKREESGGEETPKKKKEKKEKKEKKVKEMKSPLERLAPFDYDGQKSILDAEPEKKQELGGGKKDKKKKEGSKKGGKFSIDTSEFRREPRVNNAPKSGAVTASFAK
jgi:exosome complex exonuclease RRP6